MCQIVRSHEDLRPAPRGSVMYYERDATVPPDHTKWWEGTALVDQVRNVFFVVKENKGFSLQITKEDFYLYRRNELLYTGSLRIVDAEGSKSSV